LAEVDSTNRVLVEEGVAGVEGAVVLADRQSAGRGRMGRAWFSPPGVNLYLSVRLQPRVAPALMPTLSLVVGCAVARTVAVVAPDVPVGLKWPNDLLVQGRKLGGILCELVTPPAGEPRVVVGVGCNVNLTPVMVPMELAGVATSLAIETGRHFDRALVAAELLWQLEQAYELWCAAGLAPFLPEWQACDPLQGRRIRVEQAGQPPLEGAAAGVDEDGLLRIRMEDGGVRTICAGDVHLAGI
jgi:BirA family biotin operon repressor/biotin-[acetyl-CoA-carboxylase] ligase